MANLDSICVDLSDWKLHARDEKKATCVDSDGDVLQIDFFEGPPGLPDLEGSPDPVRDFLREQIRAQGNGIVEVEVERLHDVDCVWVIIKARQRPTGFTFQGSLVIPRRDFSYVIRVTAREAGTTGVREAAVLSLEMSHPSSSVRLDLNPEGLDRTAYPEAIGSIQGWFQDPYDSRHDESALCTLADQQEYDHLFRDHPLSRVRRKLNRAAGSLELGLDVRQAQPFRGAT